MALVNEFEKISKETSKVHGAVASTSSVFKDNKGNTYFQIDTYGSPYREIKNKISQSVQLNESGARKLIEILKSEFSI